MSLILGTSCVRAFAREAVGAGATLAASGPSRAATKAGGWRRRPRGAHESRPTGGRGANGTCSRAARRQSSCVHPTDTMEEELRCPACKQFFINPVLLPCYHSLCIGCAVSQQQPACQHAQQQVAAAVAAHQHHSHHAPAAATASSSSSDTASDSAVGEHDYPDVDKLSILSETDSGVVCTSRPNSYVGTPNLQGVLLFPPHAAALSLTCPVCHKVGPIYPRTPSRSHPLRRPAGRSRGLGRGTFAKKTASTRKHELRIMS
jgi:hypothetical protein